MVFVEILKTICIFFDCIIYSIATVSYVLFAAMCEMDVSSIGTSFAALVERIQVFVGILMLFVVAFQLLKVLVEPNSMESVTSDLVKKIAVTVVLLVSMNFIFTQLSGLQQALLESSTIESLILGTPSDESIKTAGYEKYVSTGKYFSNNLLFAFVTVDPILKNDINNAQNDKTLWSVVDVINNEGVFYRYPIISGACGILLTIIFISFAIDVGVRAFTLMLLQVIAPIPIIMYITPKGKGMLSKYISTYISTYIQLYAKIAIAYITLYLMQFSIKAILENPSNSADAMFPNLGDTGTFFRAILVIVVIVSLFFFAKKFPTMVKNILGIDLGGGSIDPFKITGNILKTGAHVGMFAGGAVLGGAVGAAATIGTGAGAGGVLRAAGRGALQGGQGAYRVNNVRDALTNAYTGTRDNIRNQRQFGYQIGDQGGQAGIAAQRRNERENIPVIKDAEHNLQVLNQGEEIRAAMDAGVEDYNFKNGFSGRREITNPDGTISQREFSLSGFENKEQYVEAQTAAQRQEIKTLTESNSSDSVAMTEAYRKYNEAKKQAEADVRASVDANRETVVAIEGTKAHNESIKLDTHIKANSNIYGEAKTSTEVRALQNREQQRINNATSNETAINAAQAQARGASNAASRNQNNNGGH